MGTLGKALVWSGIGAFVASVAWWLWYYGELLGENVKEASTCFYRTTTECAAGNLVISVTTDVPEYQPQLLWLAGALILAGILVTIGRSRGSAAD